MYSPGIIKKTDCSKCGFYDGKFCRCGLGWSLPKEYCEQFLRIRDKRCGNCVNYSLYGRAGNCKILGYRNFYDFCYFPHYYTKVPGKDLRPKPETPPKAVLEKYEQERGSSGSGEEHTL